MKISGSAAIVTGGASGLGGATAEALAREGAKVAIFDMNAEKGEALANKIKGIFCQVNVADEASVKDGLATAIRVNGDPRILVNCAGIGVAEKTVGKNGAHNLANYRRVIEVNLIGTFNCIRLVAEAMEKNDVLVDGERGVIVNTASVAAFDGQIGQAAYSASKGGVVGMTLPIARDLMNIGIRCNTIAPGLFMTPMMAGMDEKVKDALSAMVPFPKRLGKPEEYASLALEIVRNVMLNGETIRLDGAIRMAPK